MIQALTKPITLKEFLQLSETKPATEYINGYLIQKPMPQGEHSIIQTELVPAINAIVKPPKIARAFTELRSTFGGRSIVPDISVFLWDRIPRQDDGRVSNMFSIAPDWTIEILSPQQSQTKVTKNILHRLDYGTRMGWLLDPSEQSIFVYLPNQQIACYEDLNIELPVPDFAHDFRLTLGELFGWLLE